MRVSPGARRARPRAQPAGVLASGSAAPAALGRAPAPTERERGERPDEAVRTEEDEVDEPGTERDQHGEEHSPGARVRASSSGVRDHEEGEDQEGAVRHLMEGDRQRVPQPEGAADDDRAVGGEEGPGDVAALGAAHDQQAGAGDGEGGERRRAPLPRRHPGAVGQQQGGGDAEVGRVEDVFRRSAGGRGEADHELAADRQERGEGGDRRRPGAQQEGQREGRDQGAPGIEAGEPGGPPAEPLDRESGRHDRRRHPRAHLQVEPDEPPGEERGEDGDLVVARVAEAGGGVHLTGIRRPPCRKGNRRTAGGPQTSSGPPRSLGAARSGT
jgi:hypothetical protein